MWSWTPWTPWTFWTSVSPFGPGPNVSPFLPNNVSPVGPNVSPVGPNVGPNVGGMFKK